MKVTYKIVDNILVKGAGIKIQQSVHICSHFWLSWVELALFRTGATVLVHQVAQDGTAKI